MKYVSALSVVLCAGMAANAGIIPGGGDIVIGWGTQGAEWRATENPDSFTVTTFTTPDGKLRYRVIGGASSDGAWNASWNMVLDPDPFISNSFTVQNMSGATQPFTVTVTIPAFPALAAPTTMTGSISGTVGDGDGLLDPNGNGATVTTQMNGRPYYEALVDGAGVRSLYTAPQVNAAPLGLTADIDTLNFINEVGPAVTTTIGIRNAFTLTSSDNASFTSTFLIIPAPAGVAMVGLVSLVGLRRRR